MKRPPIDATPEQLRAAFLAADIPETIDDAKRMLDAGEMIAMPNWAVSDNERYALERVILFVKLLDYACAIPPRERMTSARRFGEWIMQLTEPEWRRHNAVDVCLKVFPTMQSMDPDALDAARKRTAAAKFDGADFIDTVMFVLTAGAKGYRETVIETGNVIRQNLRDAGQPNVDDWVPVMVMGKPVAP